MADRTTLRRWCTAIVRSGAAACAAAVIVPDVAGASTAEQQLAEKYAPVVGLKQHEPCAEHRRALPAGAGRDGARAAGRRAARAGRHGREDARRLPPTCTGRATGTGSTSRADPLDAGCSYEQWFNRIAAGKPTTAYAHIVAEQGKLALQYWFYYPFNDWNNKHESDWEMIQLVFDAATAEQALGQTPALVGYSQHEGAESATWDDEKLEKRDGHPVVYPGAGSHANQFVQSLYLGHSAQTGFGCDDTRGPTNYEQTQVVAGAVGGDRRGRPVRLARLPRALGAAGVGAEQRADRPDVQGPVDQADHLGRRGVAVRTTCRSRPRARSRRRRPASSAPPSRRGRRSTSASCATRSSSSGSWRRSCCSPSGSRAGRTGRPPCPIRSGSGATPARSIASGFRVYRSRRALFIGIGLMAIPLGALAAIAQHLLFGVTGLTALTDVAVEDPVVGAFAAAALRRVHDPDRRHARVCGVRRGARPDRRRRATRRARRLPRHRPGTASAGVGDASHDDRRGRSLSSR